MNADDDETYWDGTPYMKLKDIEAEMVQKYGPDRGVLPYRMPERGVLKTTA